jgi:hypothetical protein
MNCMKEAAFFFFFTRKQGQCLVKDCRHFNNCCIYRSVTRHRWRERRIILSSDLLRLTTTKPQQIILVILFFTMVISDIKAKLYILRLRTTRAEKPWLLFVNVIQKFQKVVQMCFPPYIQAGHRTQLSKSVLSCQNRDIWYPYINFTAQGCS